MNVVPKGVITEKFCKCCGQTKPTAEFHRNRRNRSGLEAWCKQCRNGQMKQYRATESAKSVQAKQQKQWHQTPKGRNYMYMKAQEGQRKRDLKSRASQQPPYTPARIITLDEYEQMLCEQGGLCAICKAEPNGTRLHIDHCHVTGKIRGLLCMKCNQGLGQFMDRPNLLERARLYLLRHH